MLRIRDRLRPVRRNQRAQNAIGLGKGDEEADLEQRIESNELTPSTAHDDDVSQKATFKVECVSRAAEVDLGTNSSRPASAEPVETECGNLSRLSSSSTG
jgi:hypothetical protein